MSKVTVVLAFTAALTAMASGQLLHQTETKCANEVKQLEVRSKNLWECEAAAIADADCFGVFFHHQASSGDCGCPQYAHAACNTRATGYGYNVYSKGEATIPFAGCIDAMITEAAGGSYKVYNKEDFNSGNTRAACAKKCALETSLAYSYFSNENVRVCKCADYNMPFDKVLAAQTTPMNYGGFQACPIETDYTKDAWGTCSVHANVDPMTAQPTPGPTKTPTETPTEPPTESPTQDPTPGPTQFPTSRPSTSPTPSPTYNTAAIDEARANFTAVLAKVNASSASAPIVAVKSDATAVKKELEAAFAAYKILVREHMKVLLADKQFTEYDTKKVLGRFQVDQTLFGDAKIQIRVLRKKVQALRV
jgi:hypothetical protein